MPRRQRYPYPLPELIAYLEAMHDISKDTEREYLILAELLQSCHATVEHANRLWRSERFAREQPDLLACHAVQFGFRRLIPLILGAMVGGWHELLAYVEHPERFPWYDAQTDWSCIPPLTEFRPAEDEVEMV